MVHGDNAKIKKLDNEMNTEMKHTFSLHYTDSVGILNIE